MEAGLLDGVIIYEGWENWVVGGLLVLEAVTHIYLKPSSSSEEGVGTRPLQGFHNHDSIVDLFSSGVL